MRHVTHGQRLPAELAHVLDQASVRIDDVEVIAVAAGPGSFTGLRVGIATMQGLAMAQGAAVVPVSALEALARAAVNADDADCRVDGCAARARSSRRCSRADGLDVLVPAESSSAATRSSPRGLASASDPGLHRRRRRTIIALRSWRSSARPLASSSRRRLPGSSGRSPPRTRSAQSCPMRWCPIYVRKSGCRTGARSGVSAAVERDGTPDLAMVDLAPRERSRARPGGRNRGGLIFEALDARHARPRAASLRCDTRVCRQAGRRTDRRVLCMLAGRWTRCTSTRLRSRPRCVVAALRQRCWSTCWPT